MEIIIAIALALFVVVAIGVLMKVNRKKAKELKGDDKPSAPALDCCGAHEVCEFDEIKMDESIIEYFDDEELDAFKNTDARKYTDTQIDKFREVLYTLQTKEIKHWLLSIERRKIQLPEILHEEARMLLAEK